MPDLPFAFLRLLAGFAGIWGGAILTLRGGRRLATGSARHDRMLGLGVLTVAPALPELAVALATVVGGWGDAANRAGGLVVGTLAGGALARTAFVGGLLTAAGWHAPAHAPSPPKGAYGMLIGGTACVAALIWDGEITPVESVSLGVLGLVWAIARIRTEHRDADPGRAELALVPDVVVVAFGTLVACGSGWLVVRSGLELAQGWSVDPAIVGVSVVALGTSLPELVRAAGARIRRPETGSSLPGTADPAVRALLVPFGLLALCGDIAVPGVVVRIDLALVCAAALVTWLGATRPVRFRRLVGVGLAGSYLLFVLFLMIRA